MLPGKGASREGEGKALLESERIARLTAALREKEPAHRRLAFHGFLAGRGSSTARSGPVSDADPWLPPPEANREEAARQATPEDLKWRVADASRPWPEWIAGVCSARCRPTRS